MADFSVNATSLSAPQGAGSSVVKPVSPAPETSPLPPVIGTVVDIFSKGLEADNRAKAEARKNAALGQYVDADNEISQAVSQGLTASEASARYKTLWRKFSSSYPEYIEDFKKASAASKEFGERGDVARSEALAADVRKANLDMAQKRGLPVLPGMSKEQEDAMVAAAQASVRAEEALNTIVKRNTEARTQANFDQAAEEASMKRVAVSTLRELAGAHLPAFQEYSRFLGQQVRSGKVSQDEASVLLNERFSNINSAIQEASANNPEMAAAYKGLFNSTFELGKNLIDPSKELQSIEDQYKLGIARGKVMVFNSDPRLAESVVLNTMLPNNPWLQSRASSAAADYTSKSSAVDFFSKLTRIPVGSNEYAPQVVGNPDVEPQVVGLLQEGIKMIKGGKISDKELAETQAANTTNQLLIQTGDMLRKGQADPKSLSGLAKFFASPEYAYLVNSKKIDKNAASAAGTTLQAYGSMVVKGIDQKLQGVLDRSQSVRNPGAKVNATDVITANMVGNRVVFEVKPDVKMDQRSQADLAGRMQDIKKLEEAVNQLVRMGAHMEGTQDYAKAWEANKHLFLPRMFTAPSKEKPKAAPEAPTAMPTTGLNTEASAIQFAKMSPAEQASDEARESTPGNIKELKTEIERMRKSGNTVALKVLEDYLKTVEN